MSESSDRHDDVDLLVLGTGAGGLAAAVTGANEGLATLVPPWCRRGGAVRVRQPSVTASEYPGAGCQVGVTLTFGYVAARHAADA